VRSLREGTNTNNDREHSLHSFLPYMSLGERPRWWGTPPQIAAHAAFQSPQGNPSLHESKWNPRRFCASPARRSATATFFQKKSACPSNGQSPNRAVARDRAARDRRRTSTCRAFRGAAGASDMDIHDAAIITAAFFMFNRYV
jgi:hypothetical protein